MNITQIQGIIEYVSKTGNTEPGRDIDKYYGELYNYVEKKVDT